MVKRFRIFLQPVLCCLPIMMLFCCGIESVIYLDKPARVYYNSYLDDFSKRYCAFNTADSWNTANAAGFFQGTEIYYRIYEQESDCTNDAAQIVRYNESNPSNSAQYLQDTKKYYRLTTTVSSKRPLIGSSSSDRAVRFRLQDYDAADPAVLTVGGASLGVPLRDTGILAEKRRFDDGNISANDADTQRASSSSGLHEFWYVNFYAVSYGYDRAFKTLYSAIESLGYIKIKRN